MTGQSGDKGSGDRRDVSRAGRDLVVIALVTVAAFVFIRLLDISGRMDALVRKIGLLGLHDVFATAVVLIVALAVYSLRRWKEASRAHEELRGHRERLEELVAERTAEIKRINEELEEEIAERRQAEAALKESEQRYRQLFERDPNAVFVFDSETFKIEDVNAAALELFGYGREEFLGLTTVDISAEKEKTLQNMQRLSEGEEFRGISRNFVRKDGTVFPSEVYSGSFTFRGKKKFMGTVIDVSGRRRAEEAVRASEKFLDTIFHSIHDPFSIIDRDFRIVRVNGAYAQMRNIPKERLIGRKCFEILREYDMVCDNCIVEKTFSSGDPCAKEKFFDFGESGEMWAEIFTHPIMDSDGNVSHVIEYIRDITGRKKADEENVRLIKKLEHMSRTDVLTGLMNRRAILEALGSEVERSRRYGADLSLVLCDIDYFKEINDSYGHEAGDKALVMAARSLSGIARHIDLIGRYGGDEFMLVLPETGVAGAMDFARRILGTINSMEVKLFEGGAFSFGMSVGVAGLKAEHDDADALIRRADKALYSSKRSGRNRVSLET